MCLRWCSVSYSCPIELNRAEFLIKRFCTCVSDCSYMGAPQWVSHFPWTTLKIRFLKYLLDSWRVKINSFKMTFFILWEKDKGQSVPWLSSSFHGCRCYTWWRNQTLVLSLHLRTQVWEAKIIITALLAAWWNMRWLCLKLKLSLHLLVQQSAVLTGVLLAPLRKSCRIHLWFQIR